MRADFIGGLSSLCLGEDCTELRRAILNRSGTHSKRAADDNVLSQGQIQGRYLFSDECEGLCWRKWTELRDVASGGLNSV